MSEFPEGNAIVYCQGMYQSLEGKTAHGLVRRCDRYRLLSVIDSTTAGKDAGEVLDGVHRDIPILTSIEEALRHSRAKNRSATHLVVGLAPDGGRLPVAARKDVMLALTHGLHIVSGLHDFLGDDSEMASNACQNGVTIHDVRRTPDRSKLHFFSGKIEEVKALKVALLGTDSAVGKRTTAWLLLDALRQSGVPAEIIGTGQTAWMQGARYCIILDSLINDFLSGEIEHVVWSAWQEQKPKVIIVEGQGSLLNPAYPGGYEILAAARPDVIVLQHPPARKAYDGFPQFPLHDIVTQLRAIEVVSGKPVVAISINGEHLSEEEESLVCKEILATTGLPAINPLRYGASDLVHALRPYLNTVRETTLSTSHNESQHETNDSPPA